MTSHRIYFFLSVVAATALVGCNNHPHVDDEQAERGETVEAHGFKKDHGVFVSGETRRTIGLELGEPVEKPIVRHKTATARIYAAGRATALLDSERAADLSTGQAVHLGVTGDLSMTGRLARIDRQLERSMGQVEALVEFAPVESLPIGSAVHITFPMKQETGMAIPEASLLRTGEGAFVFVVNGDHLKRTHVQAGGQEDGWVRITDGLLEGDIIATNGIQGLWCIELQATKGGAACCPVPLKK